MEISFYELTTRCLSQLPTTNKKPFPIHRELAGQAPSLARSNANPNNGKYISMIGMKHIPKVQA